MENKLTHYITHYMLSEWVSLEHNWLGHVEKVLELDSKLLLAKTYQTCKVYTT